MFRKYVLVLILSFILIGCSKEKRSDNISQDQWKALSYLPYNTYYLMYLNLDELRKDNLDNSSLQGPLSLKVKESWLDNLEAKTGIGFRNGISQIFIASAWNEINVVVAFISDGKEKLNSYFNDRTRFINKPNGSFVLKENPSTTFYFPDDSTLIILNNLDYADKVFRSDFQSVKENKSFINLLKEISIKNSYWMLANNPDYAKYLITRLIGHRLNEAKSLFKNITGITMAVSAGEKPVIETNIQCKGKKDAITLSAAMRTALVLDLFSGTNYELNNILKKAEVEREGTIVNLFLNLNKQDLNKIKELTKNISGNKQ